MPAGGVTVVVAPTMFAGKSEHADGLAEAAVAAGRRVLKITHTSDARAGAAEDTAMRHSGNVTRGVLKVAALADVPPATLADADFVWVDECQFFDDLHAFALGCRAELVLSGLYLDYRGRPWGSLMLLAARIPLKNLVYLHAVCTRCSARPAMHCPRRSAAEGVVLIGGKDEYEALCDGCLEETTAA